MKNNRAKKILSFVLAASMVFAAMAPTMSFAENDNTEVVTGEDITDSKKDTNGEDEADGSETGDDGKDTDPIGPTEPTEPIEEEKEVARIAGKDRYETAVKVAKELKPEGSERVVLASGANYADVLVGARYAKDKDAVLLLVDKALTDDVKAYLEKGTKEVTILGGSASVKEEVAKELKDAKYTVDRIAGKDRYKTAVEVANKMETVENILVASGEDYADALVASAAANKLGNSAVLLTEKSKLNDDAKEYMTTNKETAKKAYVFGGENSVTDEAMAAVKEIVEVERVKGEDRDATAVAAAKEFFKESTSAVVASGSNYADALVAGTMDEPVLLVTKNVNETVKTYLKDQIEDVKVIGGTNSVSDAILKDIAANLK